MQSKLIEGDTIDINRGRHNDVYIEGYEMTFRFSPIRDTVPGLIGWEGKGNM